MVLPNYTQTLRPVGQLLDSLRIDSFTFTMDRDGLVIRDKTRNRAQVTPREKAFLADLESHRVGPQGHAQAKRLAEGVLEWRLEWADLERLAREGQSQRRSMGPTPEANSLPQILRVIGGVVDRKRGQLLAKRILSGLNISPPAGEKFLKITRCRCCTTAGYACTRGVSRLGTNSFSGLRGLFPAEIFPSQFGSNFFTMPIVDHGI